MTTPFSPSGSPDSERALHFAQNLLANGASGIALFGTTSEGQSLSASERMALVDALIEGGLDPKTLMVGTGSCALPDAIEMTRHAVSRNCGGALLLPPYFYKAVSDDGLLDFVSDLVDAVSSPDLRIYLYHIPPVAHVGFSVELVGRILERFPEQLTGLKNSSGDHAYSIALRERYPQFDVFSGSEEFLLETMRIGGAGCISATGNINSRAISELYRRFEDDDAEDLQKALNEIRGIFQKRPMIPALKAIIARAFDDPQWRSARPPLRDLASQESDELAAELAAKGYYPERIRAH